MRQDEYNCLMVLPFPHDLLLSVLRGEVRILDIDLPEDVEIVSVHYDYQRRSFALTIRSVEFAEVKPGDLLPYMSPLDLEKLSGGALQ